MENTIANIRILDVVRLVQGYFIFVLLIINMLSTFLAKFTKNHTKTVKSFVFFVPTQKCMK
jgi:hypothetical protein